MKSIPRISDAEWEIMCIVWQRHPITANEVIEELGAKQRKWHPNTIRTLIARLVKKEALAPELQGRAYEYTPCVSKLECIAQVSESFLARVFGGSLETLFSHFITRKGIAKNQLTDLRRLVHAMDQ